MRANRLDRLFLGLAVLSSLAATPAPAQEAKRRWDQLCQMRTEKLDLPEGFTAADVFHALQPHEITEAAIYGTYSLNPAVKG